MLQLNINLAKVKDAYFGTTPDGHRCIVIPDSSVWIPDDQSRPAAVLTVDVYRHMPNQWERTALVRQHFAQAYLDTLTEAERNAIPPIGSGK